MENSASVMYLYNYFESFLRQISIKENLQSEPSLLLMNKFVFLIFKDYKLITSVVTYFEILPGENIKCGIYLKAASS